MKNKSSLLTRLCAASLTGILLFGSIAQANPITDFARSIAQEQQQTGARKPLPPIKYIASREYDTKHIRLDLNFDWDKSQAYGVSTITFSPLLANTKTVKFDQASLQINSIKLNNGAALKFTTDDANQKLIVELDKAYQPTDVLTIAIDYRTKQSYVENGILGGFGGGLRFIKPTPDEPNKPRQIWSQGETVYNRYWFPAFDSPNDFATSEIYATVEKPFIVISNGKQVEPPKDNANNTRTFHWAIESPHANYLTSIVVGDYAEVKGDYDGIPVSSFVYKNELKEGTATTKRLPEMVRWFSEETGVKYPYEKYAQTMVENFGGGMENISATTQIEEMIHDERQDLDETSDSLQSHELGHQWFGDYVTCREWSDTWLNESFATFMEATWTEKSLGRDSYLLEMRKNQNTALATWRRGVRRPIVTKYYSGSDSVFDDYAYPRGGAVINNLRQVLGDRDFWRAINHYLTKNAHQPVSTEQLRIAIEESTGQSMDWFFDQWIYKMGNPNFEVTKNYDAAAKTLTMTVRQTQQQDQTSSYPQVEFFQTPVDIEIGTASGVKIERVQIEPKAENTFTFAVDGEPKLVNFDYNGAIIKELKFDKSTAELSYQLKNDPDPIGRAWAMSELSKRLTNETDKPAATAALTDAITNDKAWELRRDAINALQPETARGQAAMMAAISGNKPKADFAPETLTALQRAVKDQKSLVRAAAIASLGATQDAKFADLYANALNDQSYAVVDSAADALGNTKSPNAYAQLAKLLDQPSWKNRVQIAALNGLANTGDKRATDVAFKYADAKSPSNVRSIALLALTNTGKGDPRVFPLLFDNFKKSLDANKFQAIFESLVGFVKLGDPRGQQAFDAMRAKFKDNDRITAALDGLETAFKQTSAK